MFTCIFSYGEGQCGVAYRYIIYLTYQKYITYIIYKEYIVYMKYPIPLTKYKGSSDSK